MKILFVGGTGRNGSTLLGNIIGELPGFTHVGELRYLWDRGILQNWDCGCGTPFSECSFWQKVIKEVGLSKAQARQLTLLRESFHSRTLLLSEAQRQASLTKMKEYLDALRLVYTTIFQITGCQWIVDSSKFPSHAYLLSQLQDFDIYIIHLVRDPRAVAYSWWKRPKQTGLRKTSGHMPRINPIVSSAIWLEWNYVLQHIWRNSPRYLFLRYEDFAGRPRETIDMITQWLNVSNQEKDRVFIGENVVRLSSQHTVSGNPARFKTGEIKISLSSYVLNTPWRMVVTTITLPLLVKYRYSIC